jgi:hypothetical protein
MKILYIHGLESKPSEPKTSAFSRRGHEIYAPSMEFLQFSDTIEPYNILKKMAIEHEVEFLAGSSYGGFMAYWLGQELGLPQLLFNPAVCREVFTVPTAAPIRTDVSSWVLLGAQDETIPAELNLEFFADKPQARVIVAQWLAHRIDIQTFEEAIRWAGL